MLVVLVVGRRIPIRQLSKVGGESAIVFGGSIDADLQAAGVRTFANWIPKAIGVRKFAIHVKLDHGASHSSNDQHHRTRRAMLLSLIRHRTAFRCMLLFGLSSTLDEEEVFRMRADPEPHQTVVILDRHRSVTDSYSH